MTLPGLTDALLFLGIASVTYSITNYLFGTYHRIWRYASSAEVVVILGAVLTGTSLLTLFYFFLPHWRLVPLSVVALTGLFSAAGFTAIRYQLQLRTGIERWWKVLSRQPTSPAKRVLIFGAGETGQLLAWRLLNAKEGEDYELVGFVDDDLAKHGMRIHGIPVLGDRHAIPGIVHGRNVELIILAIYNLSRVELYQIHSICKETQAIVKALPDPLTFVQSTLLEAPLDIAFEDATWLESAIRGLQIRKQIVQALKRSHGIAESGQEIEVKRGSVLEMMSEFIDLLLRTLGLPQTSDTLSYHELEGLAVWARDLWQGLGLPDHLPVMLLRCATLEERHLIQICDCMVQLAAPDCYVGILISFLSDRDELVARQLLKHRLQETYAYDVVLLGRQEIEKLLSSTSPQQDMRRIVLSVVNLLTISPFSTTGPTSDAMFFGRELELRNILEHCGGVSLVIIGGRRIGKTSILLRLHRVRLPTAGFRALYHDCSTTPTYEAFLAADIRDWRPEPPLDSLATFGDLLRSPLFIDKPLVLLLDEADKLVPADRAAGWPFFNALRALANSGRAQVVLTGERTLREALQDSSGPLFNFANEMLLGRLDFRAVEELVTRPMKQLEIELVNEAGIVQRIWDFTSGHPNVIQRLCRRLIERLNEQSTRRITLDDVNAIIEDPQFQEFDFLQTYWEAASPLEKIITLVLSQEARTYRLKEVRQLLSEQAHVRPSATATKDALDRLVDLRSILKQSQAGYAFAVEAFPRVLANTTTVEDLLEVLVEQYEETEAQV